MPKPVLTVVELVEDLLHGCLSGQVQGVFIVYRHSDGSYGMGFECEDLVDMLFQVRTETIRAAQKFDADTPDGFIPNAG